MLSLPEVVPSAAITGRPDLAASGILVSMAVRGVASGHMLVLFDDRSALELATELLQLDPATGRFGLEEESTIVETVNIISCSFLGALASMLHGVLIPGPPLAVYGRLAEIVREHVAGGRWALTNRFVDASGKVSGRVVLLTDGEAVSSMLSALGVRR